MRKAILMLLLAVVSNSAMAEMKADGKWYFPDSVSSICIETEQGMVATYRALIENNRKLLDKNETGDKKQILQLSEEYKKLLVENEEKWSRLGCSSILYKNK